MNIDDYFSELDKLTAKAVMNMTAGEVSSCLLIILAKIAVCAGSADRVVVGQVVESLRHNLDVEVTRMMNREPA